MKLVPTHPGTGRGKHTLTDGDGIPIPEREPLGHTGGGIEDTAHGNAVEFATEVEQPGTFGGDTPPSLGEGGNGKPEGSVVPKLGGINLGKPPTDDDAGGAGGKLLIFERIKGDDISTGGGKQLGMLGVGKGEGGPGGKSDERLVSLSGV